MRFYLIPLGIAGVLVGLGLVFPQIANLRVSGTLEASQILFFLLGLIVSVGGVGGVAVGSRRLFLR